MSQSLTQLYQQHQGKVSDKWTLYLSEYDRLLRSIQDKDITILEIGIQNGGALEIYGKYFCRARKIVGCDADPLCASLSFDDPRICVVVGDANADHVADKIDECAKAFDLIIDDGSHRSGDIIRSFLRYFERLTEDGLYIVEDLHCSYWSEFEGGLYDPYTSVSFFKRLADIINYEHWGVTETRTGLLAGFSRHYGIQIVDALLSTIHSIEFVNSLCIVRKKSEPLNHLGAQVVSGVAEDVCQGRKALHGNSSSAPGQRENPWGDSTLSIEERALDLRDRVLKYECDIAERDEAISDLERRVAERDDAISELAKRVAAGDELCARIFSSTSWRVTQPIRFVGYQFRRAMAALRFLAALSNSMGGASNVLKRVVDVALRDGPRGVAARAKNIFTYYRATGNAGPGGYNPPVQTEDLDMAAVAGGPLISVVMPVYNTPPHMLDASVMSVLHQVYQNWELIIVDDNSSSPDVMAAIKEYAARDRRVKQVLRKENGNISAALNSGIALAAGEFIAVLDHDDTLSDAALYWIARAIIENPSCDYVYTDEDKITKDGAMCYGPFYKPDWSPEYILSMMYTCHLGVYRAAIVRDIGGYRTDFDGAQDFDLTLRVLARTHNVVHVPRVLYHWRVWEQSTALSPDAKPYAERRARKALSEYLDSREESYVIGDGPLPGHHSVRFLPKGEPFVSIVIPTANGSIEIGGSVEWHIDAVTKSIFEKTTYRNYELIIVHNGNLRTDQEAYFAGRENVSLVHYRSDSFSLSDKINLGCAHARGEYLVIMNDDIRVISEDWLDQMLGMVQRKGVGVVGPKLLFPDGTIQHAGVVLLGGLPGHAYYQWRRDADGYGLGAKVNRNYLAVTGACAMTPKALFDKVGGYSDRYPLNYNDVDYCLKLHQLGYRSVYLANVELYHFEGVSKDGGRSVSESEMQTFLEDWGLTYRNDPYYNPNLSQTAPYKFG